MFQSFNPDANYKGLLLEKAAKAKVTCRFTTNAVYSGSPHPMFKSTVLFGSDSSFNGGTLYEGESRGTKIEAEQHAAFVALTKEAAEVENKQIQKAKEQSAPVKSSTDQLVGRSLPYMVTDYKKTGMDALLFQTEVQREIENAYVPERKSPNMKAEITAVYSMNNLNPQNPFLTPEAIDRATDKAIQQYRDIWSENKAPKENPEIDFGKAYEGIYDPWSMPAEEPMSVKKEKLLQKYRLRAANYIIYHRETKMKHPDAQDYEIYRKFHASAPMMNNGRVAAWVKMILVWNLFNEEKTSLQLSKILFGPQGTCAMINPILYRFKRIRKTTNNGTTWALYL